MLKTKLSHRNRVAAGWWKSGRSGPKTLAVIALCLTGTLSFSPLLGSQLALVEIQTQSDLLALMRGGFDLISIKDGQFAHVILSDSTERTRLDQTGLPYSIAENNIEAFNALRIASRRDDMGGYMTYSEITDRMNQLHNDHPDIVGEPVSIGQTVEGRDLWGIKISDQPDDEEDEPEAMFMALMHAREVITAEILFGVMDHLVDNYDVDDAITNLVNERQIWFLPCTNPDGYAYNEQIAPDGGGMWRKNRADNGDGSYGVDLNRNFDYKWAYDDEGSSGVPSRETYRGTEAFSELETQALRDFVNNHHLGVTISFHAWGNLCLYPYGYDYIQAPDRSAFTSLAIRMTGENKYLCGTGWEAIYITNGESDDWLYASQDHDPLMPFTIEAGTENDYFWPSLNRVQTLVNQNLVPCLTAIEYCDSPDRALRPLTPELLSAYLDDNSQLNLLWSAPQQPANPSTGFQIRALIPGEPAIDDAPPDQTVWDLNNFTLSIVDQHSGTHSYRVQTTKEIATLTLKSEIVLPDTISAWINYLLYDFLDHCLALEVSADGYSWTPVPGLFTEDQIVNEQNLGPGISGTSNDEWIQTRWDLGEYAGAIMKLRFRYYQFGIRQQTEKCFIDDIGPLPAMEWADTLADDFGDTLWVGDPPGLVEDALFQVRAVDAEGDYSFWSLPIPLGAQPQTFSLSVPSDWSLISIPMQSPVDDPSQLFAGWIASGSLIVLKDGFGNVLAPTYELNQIESWNPLAGYHLKMLTEDSLTVTGQRLDYTTPIPLAEGWNAVAYLSRERLSDVEALASISDNLALAKNGYGDFWAPEYDFDNLGAMEPGQGFLLWMNASDTLIYPGGGRDLSRPAGDHGLKALSAFRSFPRPGNCSENHSLILQLDPKLTEGEIVFRDGDNREVGRCLLSDAVQKSYGLAVWGETKPHTAGYADGEPFRAEWTGFGVSEPVPLKVSVIAGSAGYQSNGLSRLVVEFGTEIIQPYEFDQLSVSPNPFNSRAIIQMILTESGMTNLKILDVTGRLISEVYSGELARGSHRLTWEAADQPSGLYLLRMTSQANNRTVSRQIKLLLVR